MEVTNIPKLLSNHPEGSFLDFSHFNQRTFGTCNFTGVAPGWEMHPDTDEFFYVISGCVEITLLKDSGPEHYVAPAGCSFDAARHLAQAWRAQWRQVHLLHARAVAVLGER